MNGSQIWEIIAFLAAVVIFIPIFYRFKVNPLLAFIAAGVVLGPHMLGVIKDTHVTENIGELGLLFLMFTIGLDLSFHRFKAMRFYIFGFGVAQMAVTSAVFGIAAYLLNKSINESIIIGLALGMSSTAVALRLMQGRGEMHSIAGRATVGILLLQDLAVIPILVLLPRMANSGSSAVEDLSQSFLRAIGAITLIILIGRMVMKPLFRFVANTKNSEAFTSMIFLVFLATAWATNVAGLSISLGAFLGGMLIAETDFGHEVEAEISSFSGLLLGVFFLSVGMMIDVPYALKHIPQILLLTALVMAVKFSIIFFMERRFGVAKGASATSAVFLCQAGEFGFVIFNMASQTFDIISDNTATQLQVVVALSMTLTPFIANFILKKIAEKESAIAAANEDITPDKFEDDSEPEMENHVIVVGYGRVGQATARMLARNDVQVFVVDTDVAHIERAKKNNRPCLFGSAANEKILNVASLNKAKAVAICISGLPTAIRVLKAIRIQNADIPVFIRCNDDSRWTELTKLGATAVISETQECGIRLAAAAILMQGGDEVRLKETAALLRQENTINPPLPTAPSV